MLELPVPSLYTHTKLEMPVQVIRGKKPGPILFLSAAIHGDEINGVEIIRRVLNQKSIRRLRGSLIAIPVVIIFGFIKQSLYLPDRRDLNRSFPGSESGSLAARIAHLFLNDVISQCTHGIDLHTAAIHRENFPHVRAVLDDTETERMARSFGSPVILNSEIMQGSLREAVEKLGISIIVYEAGEALRFNELSIRSGVKGVMSVMRELGMLPALKRPRNSSTVVAASSTWIRAPQSGIVRLVKPLGSYVLENEVLGMVADPFGEQEEQACAPYDGIIIGKTNLPLVNEGEALFHVARFKKPEAAAEGIEQFQQNLDPNQDTKSPA
ncbi:MAG: succinylglutamate desuccinylase/aspartoacylase family protein, partial [Gammaproteobacteria bacterium]